LFIANARVLLARHRTQVRFDPHRSSAKPYLEGKTLKQELSERKLTLAQVLDLSIQIGEGLEAAHQKGIVHRDIKPMNLFVTHSHQLLPLKMSRKCSFGNRHPHLCSHKKTESYPDFVCATKNSLLQNDGSKPGEASVLI
jgi:serine/threonine protein kinase